MDDSIDGIQTHHFAFIVDLCYLRGLCTRKIYCCEYAISYHEPLRPASDSRHKKSNNSCMHINAVGHSEAKGVGEGKCSEMPIVQQKCPLHIVLTHKVSDDIALIIDAICVSPYRVRYIDGLKTSGVN